MKVKPTKEQITDLKRLASAQESAKEASALKRRLASFRDDNADALSGDGVEIAGMNIRVRKSLALIVENAR